MDNCRLLGKGFVAACQGQSSQTACVRVLMNLCLTVTAADMDAEATKATDLKLLATGFIDKDGAIASVVVANPNDKPTDFKLADGTGRAVKALIPAKAIQTYSWRV